MACTEPRVAEASSSSFLCGARPGDAPPHEESLGAGETLEEDGEDEEDTLHTSSFLAGRCTITDKIALILGIAGTLGSVISLVIHWLRHQRDRKQVKLTSQRLTQDAVDILAGAEGSTDVHSRAALSPDDKRELEVARRKLDEALALDGANADALNAMALVRNQVGDSEGALDYVEKSRRAGGKTPAYFNGKATSLALLGRFEEAAEVSRAGLGAFPEEDRLLASLARALAGQGLLDEAIQQARAAVEQNPTSWIHHLNLGKYLLEQGDLEQALEHTLRALRLHSGVAEIHQNLGVILGRLGRVGHALEHFKEAARLSPWLAHAHCNVAQCLVQQFNEKEIIPTSENLTEALAALQAALDREPDLAKAYVVRGLLFGRLRESERAESDLLEAIRLDPADREPREMLVELLEKTNRKSEADEVREEATRDGVCIGHHTQWFEWTA